LIVTSDNNGYVRRFDAFTGAPTGEPVAPHGWAASEILPVRMPDGRIILAVERQGRVRRFDARTGEPLGDPRRPWHAGHYGLAAAPLPDGRVILTAGGESGMSRQDVLSGAEYPPEDDRKTGTISDVTIAAPTDGPVIIAGAGYHSKVHRWDAATGAALGEPLTGHERSVRAVTTARQADGSPMFITGCEHGSVLCWDAATGELTGECLPGAMDDVSDLAVADLPDGRQLLIALDRYSLYRWDLDSGTAVGEPARVGEWTHIIAAHIDTAGIATVFLHIPRELLDGREARTEQWRLDNGTRLDTVFPGTLCAVFDDDGITWAAFGKPDGSLRVEPIS
jgi:WD40 repeat protein